jgi:PIN domain nuclease of toxin-antitoxin system
MITVSDIRDPPSPRKTSAQIAPAGPVKFLLDTCTFLWIVVDAPELSRQARTVFRDGSNEVFLSSVSAWEIAVKATHGRLPLPLPPERFVPLQRETHGIEALPLDEESVLHVHRLPTFHRDPFDRLLVCQAIAHGLIILTPDPLVTQYPVRVAW